MSNDHVFKNLISKEKSRNQLYDILIPSIQYIYIDVGITLLLLLLLYCLNIGIVDGQG